MDKTKLIPKIRIIVTVILAVIMLFTLLFFTRKSQTDDPDYIIAAADKKSGEDGIQTTEQARTAEETEELYTAATETGSEENIAAAPPVPVKAKKIYQNEFDRLRDKYKNNDIIGIVKIPGTVIYYPVAHNAQDTGYYLNKNLYKQYSAAGSIVLDFQNSVERQDPNTILYGHQMSTNSMFHTLSYYTDRDFFNRHRYIIFNTIYEDNAWEVFAFFKTHISFDYITVYFRSEQDFLDLAAEMTKRSMYDTGIEIKEGDRILTLSTCTNIEKDTRYVLVARMIKNKDDIPEEIAGQMANAVEDFK